MLRHSARFVACAGWILALILLASPTFSQYEEELINDDFFGEENRIDPTPVRLEDGTVLVLWSDNGFGHTNVLARRFSAAMEPLAEPFRVNTDEGWVSHRQIQVSGPGGGIILVTWEDSRHEEISIYGRHLSSVSGLPLGDPFRIDGDLGFGSIRESRIFTGEDGTSLAVWIARRNSKERMIARIIDAQANLGNEFLPEDVSGPDDQRFPAVTRLPDGRWMLAWSEEDASRDWNVFYRFLAFDGTPTGESRRANSDVFLSALQWQPDLRVIGSRVLAVWGDGRTGPLDLWGRWIGFGGEPDGPEFAMREVTDATPDSSPRIVPGVGGNFAVMWFGGIENRQRSMVRFFDASAVGQGPARVMDDPTSGIAQRGPGLLPNNDGTWLEFWSDDRSGVYNAYWQQYDPGTDAVGELGTLWSVLKSSSQVWGDIALFPNGEAITVWGELQFGDMTVVGRFLDDGGKAIGESFQISSIPANAEFTTLDSFLPIEAFAPRVAANGSGFVVTWAINQLGGRLNLFAQYYDRQGSPIGGNFPLAGDNEDRNQTSAQPAMLNNGGFAIAFQMDSRGGAANPDVYLQRYSPDGLPNGDRQLCVDQQGAVADQLSPAIAVSPFDEIFVTWLDRRNGGWDVYGQRFNPNGEPVRCIVEGIPFCNTIQHGQDEPFSDQTGAAVAFGSDRTVTVFETQPLTAGFLEARLEIFPSATADRSQGAELTFIRVNLDTESEGFKDPQVAMAPDGRFIVSWWENHDGQTQLLARKYLRDGAPDGEPFPIHGNGTEGSRFGPRVDVDGNRVHFLWTDSRRGKGWDIRARLVDWSFAGSPTPVLLRHFEGQPHPQGGVDLSWSTSSELGFAGFHLHREVAGEDPQSLRGPGPESVQITSDLVRSGNGQYAFADRSAPAETHLVYFLEAVDLDGRSEFFGPRIVHTGSSLDQTLAQPNPFRDRIALRLPPTGPRGVEIFAADGRRIRQLRAQPGQELLIWDGRDVAGEAVPGGVYFARPEGTSGPALKLIRVE